MFEWFVKGEGMVSQELVDLSFWDREKSQCSSKLVVIRDGIRR